MSDKRELRGPYEMEQEIKAELPEMIARRDAETDTWKAEENVPRTTRD